MANIPLRDHIAIRLSDFRGDGTAAIFNNIDAVMRRQSAAGMLASGNTIHEIEREIREIYKEILDLGASFIGEAVEDDVRSYVDLLDPFARAFARDIMRAYEDAFPRLGLRTGPAFANRAAVVTSALNTVLDRVVGDFKIGLARGKRMTSNKASNSANFAGANINAPVTLNQVAIVGGADRELHGVLQKLLSSPELAAISQPERDEIKDAADAAVGELETPSPDRMKVAGRLRTIIGYLAKLGQNAAAGTLEAIATSWAEHFGLTAPGS